MTQHRATVILLILGLIGFGFSLNNGRQVWELSRQRDQLAREVGYLTSDQPSKASVIALPSEDDLHFRWRVYTPANYRFKVTSNDGSSSSSRSEPADFIAEVRFKVIDGKLMVYRSFQGGSSLSSVGSDEFATFITERWSQLDITQLGTDGTAIIEPDQRAELLTIKFSEALRHQAKEQLAEHEFRRFDASILTLRFGEAAAFD